VSWRCCSRPRIWATGRKIFSPEHDAYRATARRFFKKEIEPFVKEWQNDVFFPAEVFKLSSVSTTSSTEPCIRFRA